MAKNIVIQESGVAQTLNTISRVVTSGQSHGSVDWVPEDETQLGEITIKKNGEYPASASGLYAFSKVTVNAKGKAVGKNKSGVYVVYDVDENGYLVEHGLPTRINVVTPPTKTSYYVGEAIDIKGMVVKAYYSDDSEYGSVLINRVSISPTTAGQTEGTQSVSVAWSRDGDGALLTGSFNIYVSEPQSSSE